eukprot:3082340-Prymnesium_polylepis.1
MLGFCAHPRPCHRAAQLFQAAPWPRPRRFRIPPAIPCNSGGFIIGLFKGVSSSTSGSFGKVSSLTQGLHFVRVSLSRLSWGEGSQSRDDIDETRSGGCVEIMGAT